MLAAVAAVLASITTALSAWSAIATQRQKRRQELTAATVEAARVQLASWEGLMEGWQAQLRECRDSETRLITQLSSARTEIIALAKVITGEFPRDMALRMIASSEWERSAHLTRESGGDPSLAE